MKKRIIGIIVLVVVLFCEGVLLNNYYNRCLNQAHRNNKFIYGMIVGYEELDEITLKTGVDQEKNYKNATIIKIVENNTIYSVVCNDNSFAMGTIKEAIEKKEVNIPVFCETYYYFSDNGKPEYFNLVYIEVRE